MLVACRLAGLSALEAHYAGVSVSAQFGAGVAARGQNLDRRRGPSGSNRAAFFRHSSQPFLVITRQWSPEKRSATVALHVGQT
jgi:hypothetical protein